MELGQELGSLERFGPGSEPAGTAGISLQAGKGDWLVKTWEWAGRCNTNNKFKIREPTLTASEEGIR